MEEGQEDADMVTKVACLSHIATNLRRYVEELKAWQMPSTPLEVLEEQNKTTSEVVERIRQGEKLCTEAVEVVSMMWEVLLEDETVENINEDVRQDNLKIIVVKEDMKKLSIKERITKVTELKRLQHEVKTLYDQEKKKE